MGTTKGSVFSDLNYTQYERVFGIPAPLLKEVHHRESTAPWFEGLADAEFVMQQTKLTKQMRLLEIGCGAMRVGIHLARFLGEGNYFCIESNPYSLYAAIIYEIPYNGLVEKRPRLFLNGGFDLHGMLKTFGIGGMQFDVIYSFGVLDPGKMAKKLREKAYCNAEAEMKSG